MELDKKAEEWIRCLELTPHPEGGYYRETYRSNGSIARESLPEGMDGTRSFGTAIYFLLTAGQVSRWHQILSDELWFFHAGAPLEVLVLRPDGVEQNIHLGLDFNEGQLPQAMVPARSWFGSRLLHGQGDFSLVSCTVSPGFDFRDFRLASEVDTERWPGLWKYPDLMPLFCSNP